MDSLRIFLFDRNGIPIDLMILPFNLLLSSNVVPFKKTDCLVRIFLTYLSLYMVES